MSQIPLDWRDNGPGVPASRIVRVACTLEAAAPKPGNVHPGASFSDVAFEDFVASAVAIEPVFRDSGKRRVGQVVYDAVRVTRDAVGTNTNIGMVLLLAPLAAVPRDVSCRDGIGDVLAGLNADDCQDVYAAIRLAQPGGLGKTNEADVTDGGDVTVGGDEIVEDKVVEDKVVEDRAFTDRAVTDRAVTDRAKCAPPDLLAAMRMAADRDLVARQFANGFADVLEMVTPAISRFAETERIEDAIVLAQLATMAEYPDSLIQRKSGRALAVEASQRAARVLEEWEGTGSEFQAALKGLDDWLRADGNRRNPGTTADLLAAALFVYIRDRGPGVGRIPT